MMVAAVKPSAIVNLSSSNVVRDPSASCTSPLAILNRNTPGIIDTTEANPMAANGICVRRETGVRITPTTAQSEPPEVTVQHAVYALLLT